ncbi:MAG: tRNA 2-selenouridine(34) synthase MnmH [Nitrosomonadales bacterium]|nr:tRNA 2-selenouridine(34) synthase MnmH [Nitrosomonadales bacterium]
MKHSGLATIEQLHEFDEIVDVRSPSEYAEDHIPGAVSCPVLNDEERARVGTLYKQSPFEAKKIGAALVARNIAKHLETHWLDKPKSWHPFIYCWRGGQRSGAMTHILRQIGFNAERLEGGYKNYRHHVLEQMAVLPARFSFRVVCGLTGSGKSRLLGALQQAGAQVLDLEGIARHRGSVLGDMPDAPQPAQKGFDSQLLAQLKTFDPALPVYVESESKKIGVLRVPDALLTAMRDSLCLRVDTPPALRVALLREDYAHFLRDPELLMANLDRLKGLYANDLLEHWRALCAAQAWDEFIAELLERHYDPSYNRSIRNNYPNYDRAYAVIPRSLSAQDFERLAQEALAMPGDFDNNGGNS